ncbi:hypothetical protein [Treponema berlinense]|uniref:hypothetical protein n=1 Tax=Treponema berlinense TaxID=225004 RepID=UPI003FD8EEEB
MNNHTFYRLFYCSRNFLKAINYFPYLVQKGDELVIPYKKMFDGNSSGLDF